MMIRNKARYHLHRWGLWARNDKPPTLLARNPLWIKFFRSYPNYRDTDKKPHPIILYEDISHVEKAVVTLRERERRIIVLHYVYPQHCDFLDNRIQRAFGLSKWGLYKLLERAEIQIGMNLFL